MIADILRKVPKALFHVRLKSVRGQASTLTVRPQKNHWLHHFPPAIIPFCVNEQVNEYGTVFGE